MSRDEVMRAVPSSEGADIWAETIAETRMLLLDASRTCTGIGTSTGSERGDVLLLVISSMFGCLEDVRPVKSALNASTGLDGSDGRFDPSPSSTAIVTAGVLVHVRCADVAPSVLAAWPLIEGRDTGMCVRVDV